ncbi:MAG: MerR family transcriptional regulator [Rivularia sp. (in: cyanobacteria)]
MQQTSKRLGVSTKTRQWWDASGKFPAIRTPTGYRRYRESDVNRFAGILEEITRRNAK